MLYTLDSFIEAKGNDTEDNNACDHHIQLEDLTSVDDQITKTALCCQKFADDDAHQCKTDVDFGGTDHSGNGARQYDFGEGIFLFAAKGID